MVLIFRLLMVLACLFPVWAASPDSLLPPRGPDTLFVIPAGPVAGSFTPAARLSVEDTVAGWARVRVEGWVRVEAVLDRMQPSATPAVLPAGAKASPPGQCQGITKKGKRCTRRAAPGSIYCWQHQKP